MAARREAALADPARRLRDAAEPLAMHATGSAHVRVALEELGLDRLAGYVWGRAAALGEPAPALVVATFGVFEPNRLGAAYGSARSACPRDRLLAVREAAVVGSLCRVLGEPDVSAVVTPLLRGVSALPPGGRPLFAGLLGAPLPEHPLGRLWRACELLREHRGDTHLQAVVARGLHPVEANLLTELWLGLPAPAYTLTRGWSAEQVAAALERLHAAGLVRDGRLTGDGARLRTELEVETNRGERRLVEALGADLDRVVAALDRWSTRCIAAGAFTPDPGKRAAG